MAYSKEKQAQLLEIHEGYRKYPYKDTVGKLTIGIGFNLDDEGLYDEEIKFILSNRIDKAVAEMQLAFPVWKTLCTVRKIVLIDMLFNMGLPRLRKFKKMWAAIHKEDYEEAAIQMIDSRWAKQVGRRAYRLAGMMRSADWPLDI